MAAPDKQRFYHLHTVKHGVNDHNTLKEIEWTDNTEEIADSGDDDAVDTFLEAGKSEVRGTMLIADPIQAYALRNAVAANLTFKGKAKTGGTDCLVTIKSVKVFGVSPRFMHGGVSVSRLTWRAYDPAGGALVTIATA